MHKNVTKDDFDFTKAGEYRKMQPLAKQHVRIATQEEKVISYHSTGVEAENIAQPGDYIIKTKDDGDGYVMQAHRFPHVWEDDPLRPGFYRNKETRVCLLTLEDVVFEAPWGGSMNVSAGGVIVEAGRYIYGIDKFSFIKNYGRVDGSPEKKTFVMVSEPLIAQLEKAHDLGLENHIADIELRRTYAHLFDKKE